MKRKREYHQTGAAFVEMAITLPLFIGGLLLFIWIGIIWNEKSSFTYAVGSSLRLAITRGDTTRVGNMQAGGVSVDNTDDLLNKKDLFASPDQENDYIVYYDAHLTGPVFGDSFKDVALVAPEYALAVMYLNQALKQSIGPSVRYPCDPNDPTDGDGCVSCTFLNPDTQDTTPWGTNPIPRNRIAIRCSYQPSIIILSSITALLGGIAGPSLSPTIVFTEQKYFDGSAS